MKNKYLLKIAGISGWLLLAMLVFYFVSGYAIVHKYGLDSIMSNSQAWFWHKYLTIPFFIFLILHIVPYFIVRKQVKKFLVILTIVLALPIMSSFAIDQFQKPEVKPPAKTGQENKVIKCPNCPRGCIIKEGETGECGQYKNIDGKLQPKKQSSM